MFQLLRTAKAGPLGTPRSFAAPGRFAGRAAAGPQRVAGGAPGELCRGSVARMLGLLVVFVVLKKTGGCLSLFFLWFFLVFEFKPRFFWLVLFCCLEFSKKLGFAFFFVFLRAV